MSFSATASFDDLLERLRAVAEPTRLRLLLLLAKNELNVSDLVEITGQSQPRISRHLKLLQEAGLLVRIKEGSFVFYKTLNSPLFQALLEGLDPQDLTMQVDFEKLYKRRADLNEQAMLWFQSHANEWDKLRALHVSERQVESAMLSLLPANGASLLDCGTGTGRVLELFADKYEELLGIDNTPAMLAVARANLASIDKASVRLGNLYALDLPQNRFDSVIIHQVLHYLDEPAKAVQQAALRLKPNGNLLIVDFAPHDLEILREEQAHRRLGFSVETMQSWLQDAGLTPIRYKELKPENTHHLTVCLWLAQKEGKSDV